MGILSFGIFDGFEKRTGPLVGRIVNNKHVISIAQHKPTAPSTLAQLKQQARFKLVVMLVMRLRQLIALGFADKRNTNPFNDAIKYNFKQIVIGTYPNYDIDYSKVVYSKGRVEGPKSPHIAMEMDSIIFSWQADNQSQFSRSNDLATLLVYNPQFRNSFIAIGEARRSTLGYTMILPYGFTELELHCYMGFVSADKTVLSNSIYLGCFIDGILIN